MKTLLNLIFSYILPSFFLDFFPRDKFVPLRWKFALSSSEPSDFGGFDRVVLSSFRPKLAR